MLLNWIEAVAIALQDFGRLEIKHGPALRGPLPAVPIEDGRRGAQVADRFDVFHSAAFNGLEADGHTHQADKLAIGSVARQNNTGLKAAFLPRQPARLPGCGCGRNEIVLQSLPVPRELAQRSPNAPRKQPRPRQRPKQPRDDKKNDCQKPKQVTEHILRRRQEEELAAERHRSPRRLVDSASRRCTVYHGRLTAETAADVFSTWAQPAQ